MNQWKSALLWQHQRLSAANKTIPPRHDINKSHFISPPRNWSVIYDRLSTRRRISAQFPARRVLGLLSDFLTRIPASYSFTLQFEFLFVRIAAEITAFSSCPRGLREPLRKLRPHRRIRTYVRVRTHTRAVAISKNSGDLITAFTAWPISVLTDGVVLDQSVWISS